ncbi:MAG: RNA polymerase sigma factor [Planctomycetales bacterium]|nr:RNA polymerase sigma factor [Planctomycetales bacterium]
MDSDEVLVIRSQRGDTSAFESLVARYERSVLSVARSVVADAHVAEECTQEAFVSAWSAIAGLRKPSSFGAWLMLIAKRTAIGIANSEKRHSFVQRRGEIELLGQNVASPQVAELFEMLERLADEERLLLTMHYFDGHSARDISTMTGRPVGSVTKMMSRAYQKLRMMSWNALEVNHDS